MCPIGVCYRHSHRVFCFLLFYPCPFRPALLPPPPLPHTHLPPSSPSAALQRCVRKCSSYGGGKWVECGFRGGFGCSPDRHYCIAMAKRRVRGRENGGQEEG